MNNKLYAHPTVREPGERLQLIFLWLVPDSGIRYRFSLLQTDRVSIMTIRSSQLQQKLIDIAVDHSNDNLQLLQPRQSPFVVHLFADRSKALGMPVGRE